MAFMITVSGYTDIGLSEKQDHGICQFSVTLGNLISRKHSLLSVK